MKSLLVVGLLALSACASPRSAHDLAFVADGEGRTVRIDEGRAYGPNIEVDKYEDGYRGVWQGRTIELRVREGRVMGTIGTLPIDIHVKDENGTLDLQGMVGGQLGNLEIDENQVVGQFNGCGYELKKAEVGYEGLRCGASVTTLRMPVGWGELSASERAAFLALMLSS